MTRSTRIAPVQKVLEGKEQAKARRLGLAQQAVADAQARLLELRTYQADYAAGFDKQVSHGAAVHVLQDYRAFLVRLVDAVRQQEQLVEKRKLEMAMQTAYWQSAARQSRGLDSVVAGWKRQEERVADRLDQAATDERALTMLLRKTGVPS
jgi:flagellar FliJ protein